ncbi:hypothetical protein, partial [Halorhodospira sp. 9622]|uniref:hypothetical protein n=1 Tax=Halorhodospira sp. 9622 TaxID=2899136 RepID=UPI001EE95F03
SSPTIDVADQPKDRWFNPYRVARSERAKALMSEIAAECENHERRTGLRTRKRRPRDQEIFQQVITALVANLVYHHLIANDGEGVAISRSRQVLGRKSRYRPKASSSVLPQIMDRLAAPELGIMRIELGHQEVFSKARRTRIWPERELIKRIDRYDLHFEDLGMEDHETVYLKSKTDGTGDPADLVEYEDTELTNQLRSRMLKINQWLNHADILVDDLRLSSAQRIDPSDRHLRRYFTRGSFQSGGRLFGGFWQPMSKADRLDCIAIDDEPVVSLDYSQMAPRILYAKTGLLPTFDDAYTIPGLIGHRGVVKKIFNALLFVEQPMVRLPRDTRGDLPWTIRGPELIDQVKAFHAPIAHHFETGIGHSVQYTESEILVGVLEELRERHVVALPIHDAVLVKESARNVTKTIMEEVFYRHTGLTGLVTEET